MQNISSMLIKFNDLEHEGIIKYFEVLFYKYNYNSILKLITYTGS